MTRFHHPRFSDVREQKSSHDSGISLVGNFSTDSIPRYSSPLFTTIWGNMFGTFPTTEQANLSDVCQTKPHAGFLKQHLQFFPGGYSRGLIPRTSTCGSLVFSLETNCCLLLGGGFKYQLFSPLLGGEMIQFDKHFSKWLKPPTRSFFCCVCLFIYNSIYP